jgi:nicotinamidase-related amidase
MPDLMQNDFVLPGAPGCVAGAAATVPRLREVLDWFRTKRWPVFHIDDATRPCIFPVSR